MKNPYPCFWPLLKIPYQLLSQKEMPIGRYVVTAALISITPVAVVITAAVVFDYLHLDLHSLVYSWPIPGHPRVGFMIGLADILLISPLVETGFTLIPIWLLRRMRLPEALIPLASGLLFGILHCRGPFAWIGMVHAWPFYCFTVILMTHEKPSLDRAWFIASAVHSLTNVVGLPLSVALAYIS